MRITNLRSFAVEIAESGQHVKAGETVNVEDDLAARLLEQSDVWAKAKASKASSNDNDKDGEA